MSKNQIIEAFEKPEMIRHPGIKPLSEADKPSIVHELDRNVLDVLKREGPVTRSKLVVLTGVARSTLYDSLLRLILKGYATSYSEDRKQRGRPKVYYRAL
jgi:predicted ArsR family transcriptional regulator